MALRATFNMPDINALIERKKQAFHDLLIFRLRYLGEECVKIARERGAYLDQTGNLRSSTGYVISHEGSIISESGFDSVNGIKPKAENGSEIGLDLAKKLSDKYNSGYALIVVAGMEYALSVESKGYDVLTSAELYAKDEIKDILKKVVSDVAKIK